MRRAAPLACSACLALAAAALLPPPSAAEDARVAWLRREAVAIRSIAPGDEDFRDLEPLRAALAGARVVVLGEATHGDGSAFLVKSRLVRFLHRELGFDVLAFESGFYDCWKAGRLIAAGADPDAALRQSVFPIWTRSVELQPLAAHFAAAARSPRPLALAGFDSQFTGELSRRHLLDDLAEVAAAAGLERERFVARVSGPLANLVEGRYESGELPEPAARAALVEALAELESRLRAEGSDFAERGFWLRLLASTRESAAASWAMDFSRSVLESPAEYAVRERLLGEHLAWLARERFPGSRIVAWTHSGHAARRLSAVDVPSPVHARLYRTLAAAGEVARDRLGDELYTVAVLAYQGSYRMSSGRHDTLLRPTAGSLEDLLHRAGFAHAFLDLRRGDLPRWLRRPLVSRPIGYKEMRAPWPEIFDGLLFLDRMEPSALLPEPPP